MILGAYERMEIGKITRRPFLCKNGKWINQPSMPLKLVTVNDFIKYWIEQEGVTLSLKELSYPYYYRVSVD